MIQESFIRDWRSRAPWRSWAMIEQDLVICRCIVELFSEPVLADELAFRGGTALHKLNFESPRRYSEDIDLVQINAGPIGPLFDALRKVMEPLLGNPRRKQGPGVVTLTYRMESEIQPVVPLKLKVEINTREHFSVRGLCRKFYSMQSPWFSGECDVPTFDINELLGTKLRALYQRRKGRDLFDLWLGLTEGGADPQKIADVFRAYMEHGGQKVSRAEFAENLAAKKEHPFFTADLSDLLPVGMAFKFDEAFDLIENEILPCL